MAKEQKSTVLKLVSAIALDGEVLSAGELVEVDDTLAKQLIHRGKAVLSEDHNQADAADADLSKLNVAQLKELAKGHGIEGADGMKKDDLVAAIKQAEAK